MNENRNGDRTADRWMPSRAGIINVWRYVEEVFEFHRGRLLLRGPNGSGKSMALELLFPFLLDARADRSRLSSAARSRGGLHDRLMSGLGVSSRVGFLWAEFVRGDEAFTIGVRLRAGTGSPKVDKDWFTSTQRCGVELHFLEESRTPLSRASLKEAVETGGVGRVYAAAEDYRAAVRTTLFPEFSAEQYDALLAALLALRVEKVSQNISPEKLGDILTASLPPLDEREVAGLAEGFEKLDRRKEDLELLRHQFHFASNLAKHLRAYARNILARESGAVRAAESTRDLVTRNERAARAKLEGAKKALAELKGDDSANERNSEQIEATSSALRSSDAYRDGAQLDPLREHAEGARQAHARAQEALDGRRLARDLFDREREDSTQRHSDQLERTRAASDALASLAGEIGAGAMSADLDLDAPDRSEDQLVAWIDGRHQQIASIRSAIERRDHAESKRDHCEGQVVSERAELDELALARDAGEETRASLAKSFIASLRSWAQGCEALAAGELLARLEGVDRPQDAHAAIDVVLGAAREELAKDQALCGRDVDRVNDDRAAAAAERDRLARGEERPPEPPRDRRDRSRAAGAAFWSLVDFRAAVDQRTRDRVEAALACAGLLDAWVTTNGGVHLADGEVDTFLASRKGPKGDHQGQRLSCVLEPAEAAALEPSIVGAILEGIELCDDALCQTGHATETRPTVIGRDGSFRLALLAGMSPAKEAAFIGAASRERERKRRIAALDLIIDEFDRQLVELRGTLARLEARTNAISAERELAPTGDDLLAVESDLRDCELQIGAATHRLRRAESDRRDADRALGQAQTALEHLAGLHELPTRGAELDRYSGALRGLAGVLRTWVRACKTHRRRKDELDRALEKAKAAAGKHDLAASDLETCAREHDRLRTQLRVLDETIGEQFRGVRKKLEIAELELRACKKRRKQIADDKEVQARRVGEFETILASAGADLEEAEEARVRCHRQFVTAIADGLSADAGIPGPDTPATGVTAILAEARRLAPLVTEVAGTIKAITRASNAVGEALHKASSELGGRVDLSFEESTTGDWSLMRASSQGIRQTIPQLVDTLSDELAAAEGELLEGEQRLFDETLTGSVRRHVASRIRLANQLVDRLNEQLAAVKTDVAGVGIRLKWVVDSPNDSPTAVRSARGLLLRDPADLSDAERESLYEFFRSRIDLVRTGEDALAAWDAQLVEALDYRAWHRFHLQVGHASWEGYKDATASRWAKLSTGERSIALHLPMLASIVAHYQTGASGCPRLIVLDELFAGVDPSNRAKLLGMLVTWDLDAVFTSDHEWCSYATLDGIAIHHIHADGHEVGEPVTSSRFVWNGRRNTPSPVAVYEQ